MRGEQLLSLNPNCLTKGSPPLARGTVQSPHPAPFRPGITPACAGNSNLMVYQGHKAGDHPRLRGEQNASPRLKRSSLGSPPLARGTAFKSQSELFDEGITPACAGNSPVAASRAFSARDHPRLRGEQSTTDLTAAKVIGSPPLARGTDPERRYGRAYRGITPACAGNRTRRSRPFLAARDHPRLRGEQLRRAFQKRQYAGSPPLARGTAMSCLSVSRICRITPACAGNRP